MEDFSFNFRLLVPKICRVPSPLKNIESIKKNLFLHEKGGSEAQDPWWCGDAHLSDMGRPQRYKI